MDTTEPQVSKLSQPTVDGGSSASDASETPIGGQPTVDWADWGDNLISKDGVPADPAGRLIERILQIGARPEPEELSLRHHEYQHRRSEQHNLGE
jgi:hypothetical protein